MTSIAALSGEPDPVHILFLTENFVPEVNAAASRVYERARYWVQWGHRVTVITTAPNFPDGKVFEGYRNAWYRREVISGIEVVRVKSFIRPNRGVVSRICDFLSFMVTGFVAGLFQEQPDIVAATSPQFFTAVAGFAVAKMRRLDFVFELGDLWPASIVSVGAMKPGFGLRMMEKLELFLYRHSSAVVALTGSFKDDLTRRGIAPGKVSVVINGVDLRQFRPAPRDEALARSLGLQDKFVVGYVGTHGMAHALEKVLNAAEQLRQRTDVAFLFVGAGAERDRLVRMAKEMDLTNVVFVPRQAKHAMPAYWSLCDLALVPLRNIPVFETVIPSKTFEAMGMGVPVVMFSPRNDAVSIVEREGCGLWVQPEDARALTEAVMELQRDRDRRARLRTAALAAAPRYSREAQACKMLDVFEKVLAGEGEHVGDLVMRAAR